MVVDNSIVVVDHILRHIFKGKDSINSAIDATGEVGAAITASTLTTIVVFVPLLFVSGLIPLLFKQLAYSVIITLLASLFVAFTLSPMIMARFCSCEEEKKKGVVFVTKFISKIEDFYEEISELALKNSRKVVIGFSLLFVVSLITFIFFTGKEFMPKSDEQMLDIIFEGPKGMQLEDTIKISQKIEKTLIEKIGKENIYKYLLRVGESGIGGLAVAFGQKEASYSGSVTVKLIEKTKRKISIFEVAEILRKELRKIPGLVKVEVQNRSTASASFFGGGKIVSIELRGDNLDQGLKIAKELKTNLENIAGIRDVSISLEKGSYELWVKLNREKASMLGLSSYGVADTLRKIYYGTTVGRFKPQSSIYENEYDIFVKLSKKDKEDLKKIYSLPILLPSGKVIPLDNIAEFSREFGPEEILRKDGVRVIKIESDIYGRALNKVREDIEDMLKKYNLPSGFDIKFGGEVKEQQNTFRDLTLMLFLAILLVYLIMVGQFESFVDPFIILFSIPFAVTGVLIGLFLWGQNFNVLSFVGLLILMGVVVNNAIVLVDYINLLRNRGKEIFSAIKESGRTRLKPVLMTAITTILGALPLAISNAEGAEYFSSMGIAIIGGLSISTLITLIFVPVIYSIIHTKYLQK
jgi:HAE1 family hydrophobic/amphiphilic exporter-1